MKKNNERRSNGSVSLKLTTWEFIDKYAENNCMTKSGVVELAILEFIKKAEVKPDGNL